LREIADVMSVPRCFIKTAPPGEDLRRRHDLFSESKSPGLAHSMSRNAKRRIGSPVVIALAVAVLGMLAMLIVDHGPWSRPHIQTAETANYTTTDAAAQTARATVTATAPKPQLEPIAPGPKPAQPANAAAGTP
jgi:hypothetical protein